MMPPPEIQVGALVAPVLCRTRRSFAMSATLTVLSDEPVP